VRFRGAAPRRWRPIRRGEALAERIAELASIQAETAGRLAALGDGLGGREAQQA
jgi:hypothetical protein